MRSFVVCIHDATPAYARETELMIRDLAPLVGRRLAFAVVPDWRGEWPLAAHADYCRLVQESSDELLLHGFSHQRRRGWGPVSLLVGGADEMNGLGPADSWRLIERGQQVLADVFGERARGFIGPAWQRGHVQAQRSAGLDYVMGFFSIDSAEGVGVPLATSSWDCARWSWPGHVGDAGGRLLRLIGRRVPVLAIHPRDLERGFWPRIVRLTRELLDLGYAPCTPADLLEARFAADLV